MIIMSKRSQKSGVRIQLYKNLKERKRNMEPTGEYVIFREDRDEFLCAVKKGEVNHLGWCASPTSASKYLSCSDARRIAQRIADNKGYCLTICELHESDGKIGLANLTEVLPSSV